MDRRHFLSACAAVLSGCASWPSGTGTAKCCDRLADARYSDYLEGTLVLVTLDEQSPQYSFSTGPSAFAGFRLRSRPRPQAVLEVVTEYQGIWLPSATIFVPRFAFLDESFAEIASDEPELFQGTGKLYRSGLVRDEFYGACFVPPQTAYVVAYTDLTLLKTRTVRYLSPGGMSASMVLEWAEEDYQRIDKREFAKGRVRHLAAGRGFATFGLSRTAFGEFRFTIA